MKTAVIMLVLPTFIYVVAGQIMLKLSHRHEVEKQLLEADEADRQPLNMRLAGYDEKEASRFWGILDDRGLDLERRFLEIDLLFPFCYGGALAVSLLIGWACVGRSFNPAWAMLPVVVSAAADWVENLLQLGQLQRYVAGGGAALETGWIRVASVATQVKLLGITLCCLFVIVLAARCALAAFAD